MQLLYVAKMSHAKHESVAWFTITFWCATTICRYTRQSKQWLLCYLASLAGVAGCTDPVAALLASLTASDCCCAAHVTMCFQSGFADAQQAVEEKPDCCSAYAALGP